MTELVIVAGELTTSARIRRRGTLLVGAALAWLAAFLVLPSLLVVALAFCGRGEQGQIEWHATLENFARLLGFGRFGWASDNLVILGRSVLVAGLTTVICVALSYPLAFFIAARPPRWRYLLLALVMIPSCTNLVIRTYAWMLILSGQSPPAQLAQGLGLVAEGSPLYPSAVAVYLGMVNVCLPFTVLPLYTSVERLDWSLVEAARDLYASRWRLFRHAILTQTLPGLGSAVILTFIPALGMFLVSDLLGGARYMLVGNLIQQQIGSDWPFAAAVSSGLVALSLLGLLALRRSGARGAR